MRGGVMVLELMDHQKEAVALLGSGKVLYGGVGTGKTVTALAYYSKEHSEKDLYVITTAKKRDSLDWEGEAARLGISENRDFSLGGATITVDSWNNIGRYTDKSESFFVFDEQRVVGSGVWVKAFIRIARRNNWILLSATPGDTWLDYAPIFIANGWYKNLTEFKHEHVIYAPYVKFPKVLRYVGIHKLEYYRNEVLVEMPYINHTNRIVNYLTVGYDSEKWNMAVKKRWHPFENRPIKDMGEMFRVMRKISNTDPSRIEMVRDLLKLHPKIIIFYNFNYELELLRTLSDEVEVAEYNGNRKDPVPKSDAWVYLVQYIAGSEAWNCTDTDTMILYSLSYSYKNHIQCMGRIDRINTQYTDLFYYVLGNNSPIDRAVRTALDAKKNFNERELARKWGKPANKFMLPEPLSRTRTAFDLL
jgi:hypothetical protein